MKSFCHVALDFCFHFHQIVDLPLRRSDRLLLLDESLPEFAFHFCKIGPQVASQTVDVGLEVAVPVRFAIAATDNILDWRLLLFAPTTTPIIHTIALAGDNRAVSEIAAGG